MRISLFFITALLLIASLNIKSLRHVVTHSRTSITTDSSKGTISYLAWGEFPVKGIPIRKIIYLFQSNRYGMTNIHMKMQKILLMMY